MFHLLVSHNNICTEIFLVYRQLVKAPSSAVAAPVASGKVAQAESSGTDGGGIDDDLQARLDNLRKM